MPDRSFDVVCVGCGPAGNLAAYLLAKRGLAVLLIDQQRLPRIKPCGGGLSAKALKRLPYDISSVVHHRMHGAHLRFTGGASVHLRTDSIGAMVERAEFDSFMCDRAAQAGAVVKTRVRLQGIAQDRLGVDVDTSAGAFRASALIGADGANSTVRRLLFPDWRPERAFAFEAKVRWTGGEPESQAFCDHALMDFRADRHGYGWIFPKRDHFNVGIYRLNKSAQGAGLRQALHDFVQGSENLRSGTICGGHGYPIPLCAGGQPVQKGRVVLIGDAAGLSESFFGEGIAQSLRSASIAAEWMAGALDHAAGQWPEDFESALRPMVVELRRSFLAARILYAIPPAWLARLASSPDVIGIAESMLRGHSDHPALLRRLPALVVKALTASR